MRRCVIEGGEGGERGYRGALLHAIVLVPTTDSERDKGGGGVRG